MIRIQSTSPVSAAKSDPELRKAAEAFEAVILRQMMATMRKAKLAGDMFGSSATDNFREMADAKLADNMSGLRQFGIADLVQRQLAPKAQNPFVSSAVNTPIGHALPEGLSASLEPNGMAGSGGVIK